MSEAIAGQPGIPSTLDRAYAFLSGDDAADRSCAAIPDSACTALPQNYLLNVANGACTKLAEQLASPGLVLPWVIGALGAPAFLVGLLQPVKQAGSLLPQLAVAGSIRRLARRKWAWVMAGATQAACLLLMIPAAILLPPLAAGIAIVALLALFSMASGVGSVAFQDVTGKTVPKGRRGRMLANRAAIGGALTLAAGIGLRWGLEGESESLFPYLLMIATAAILWALGALCFAAIEEEKGAREGGVTPLDSFRDGMALMREVPGFRKFLLARNLLLSVELSMPIYALHAQRSVGEGLGGLGLFVIAVGIAAILSSPFWGLFADRSSRLVMALSGLVAGFAALLALMLAHLGDGFQTPAAYALVFIIIGIAEAGVRLGRKTYLVDGAPADQKGLYAAFSNTVTGLLTVIAGAVSATVLALLGIEAAILLLGTLGILSALACARMPEADRMAVTAG
ncbi:MAG: MFS transporter [Oceanibaculum nanhaiense]|uniref:MFS transporter n=1 Tax=Oceanibaculum nanhaiense TaxID=1909734 RepID=UPI0025A31BB2|nr:MFS transporter [Oceanibaculum nanhaiense]MDM7945290.1 MFS transporter [Oceanibaculum nanhaiense]